MSIRVRFEDPPEGFADGAEAFSATLRRHPGEWAIYSEDAPSSLVTRINHGVASGFAPAGHYQATGRTVATQPRRRFKVWVKFVGPEGEDVT